MSNEKKIVSTSINLPVECISTIIDTEVRDVEVPIRKAIEKLKNSQSSIYSMNTTIMIKNWEASQSQRSINASNIVITHDNFQILRIERKKIEKTNDIKFFKAHVTFNDETEREFVVPSFTKFYSSHRGVFIPIEFIRNRDILLDYTGNIVKIADAKQVEFKMTDFYNINVIYEVEETDFKEDYRNDCKHLNENCNFYLNGILANVSYNNFQKKD